jgi:hypothetical protein
MKNIIVILSFLLAFWSERGLAQGYYQELVEVSGFDTQPFQIDLEKSAMQLDTIFPDSFENKFQVFSGGFYVLQENFDGFGYPEAFEKLRSEAASLSEFYLVLGRQSDSKGIYTKYWIDVKLPNTGSFECIDILSTEMRTHLVENLTTYANENRKKIWF